MEHMELGQVAVDLFQGFAIDGMELARAVGEGKIGEALAILGEAVWNMVGQPMVYVKEYLIIFIILGIGAALIKQLGMFFQDSQVQKIGFWIVYLLLTSQFLGLYYNGEVVVQECLGKLIDFGNVFVPVFAGVLTLAAGSVTGSGYITVLLLIIYLVEQFLLNVMVPLVEGYMLLCLLGTLWQREHVEKLMELIGKGIGLGFKGMFIATTGLGILQSMLLPYVDRTKMGAVKKIVDLIPGVGGLTGTTLEMVTGSAVLLKNGIGVIGILLLVLAAAVPLLKLGFLCLLFKLASVVFGLFGEKQMMWCSDNLAMAEGYLWKTAFCGTMLFMLWIVLAVYTTNQRLMM
jgi:stage III sporulation protein AE